jgi:hypothetical protein
MFDLTFVNIQLWLLIYLIFFIGTNILGIYILLKIVYFENTYRDKSNNISFDNIYMYILVEKYGQNKSYI